MVKESVNNRENRLICRVGVVNLCWFSILILIMVVVEFMNAIPPGLDCAQLLHELCEDLEL